MEMKMSEAAKMTKASGEVIVIQMDTVAFLLVQFKIKCDRDDVMISDNGKKIAYWAYRRTPEVEQAIAEWTKRARMSTRIISEFREAQLVLRHRKARLERGE